MAWKIQEVSVAYIIYANTTEPLDFRLTHHIQDRSATFTIHDLDQIPHLPLLFRSRLKALNNEPIYEWVYRMIHEVKIDPYGPNILIDSNDQNDDESILYNALDQMIDLYHYLYDKHGPQH